MKTPLYSLALAALAFSTPLPLLAAGTSVAIRSDFPGGNITVDGNEGAVIRLSPDLRTSKPWFYWYFEAEATQPGRVTFVLPPSRIGTRGPAVSEDEGKTWKWLGTDNVTFAGPKAEAPAPPPQDTFTFDFTKAGQKVRFAVGFPYTQSNLDEFLKKNAGNPNLTQSVLATTLNGKPVELLQIGQPGPGIIAMAVAARSHACEALASYVLEGFLQEAMSDSPAGVDFRKKYVLYAVPILDKDGVEAGDQGKNREPHDHNRDYGTTNIYPEIKALQELAAAKQVRVGIDFHCPALKGDVHDAFHWLGLKVPHISDNADELAAWMGQERPLVTNAPLNFLAMPSDPPKLDNIPFSWYFSYQNQSLFAITLESPYAQAQDVETARAYGSALLRAFAKTQLVGPGETRQTGDFASFEKMQKEVGLLAGQPEKLEAMAKEIAAKPDSAPHYRAMIHLGLGNARRRQKQYPDAIRYLTLVKNEPGATNLQKVNTLVALVSAQTRNPDATPADVAAALAEFEAWPNPGKEASFSVYSELSLYHESKGDLAQALALTEKQATVAPSWQKSGAMLRMATLLDAMDRKDDAIAKRQEVAALLRPLMLPAPKGKSIMLGVQTGDYFDALNGIPTATLEEKKEAATIILNYPTLPPGLKEKAQDWLEHNAPKGN